MTNFSFSQIIVSLDYIDYKADADSFFYEKNYNKAAEYYENIINCNFFRRIDYMYLAKSYFELNQIDSAKNIIKKAIEEGLHFKNIDDTIYCYTDENNFFLDYLILEDFIDEKIRLIENTKDYFSSELDTNLAKELILRNKILQKILKIVNNCADCDTINFLKQTITEDNVIYLNEIIEKQGFPTIKQVGEEAVYSAFAIAFYSDFDIDFQLKCLNLMYENYQQGEIPAVCIAFLQDRILTNNSEPQIFGTQYSLIDNIYAKKPVIDEKKLEKRRNVMQLNKYNYFIENMVLNLD